ncbi:MAG: restriction endonuclease subunit S [Candidatus Electrothrix aestuarii]|uniref:Restriction endonuclease subunit S n=1 Tax=Candidatus Electrothrix aestuarii TaxID=3062594 RepID=A0AAU8LTD5_9BACT|nr:restriction endonuclease subunit S [Candidatus Electrothrix aestuarii]
MNIEQLTSEHLAVWTEAQVAKAAGGRGRGKKNGDLQAYGIKKLRELILELAVRGKLVPQDPADEPAAVLLERIAAEKARLVKEGKIKRQKKLPEIAEEEKPFALPEGWEWVSLSQLGDFSGGKTPSKSKSIYWNGDVAWVTPKDMKAKYIFDTQDHVTSLAVDEGLRLYENESILFVVRSGILRHTFPVAIAQTPCTVNQDLKVLSLYNKELSSYLYLMMKGFERYILSNLSKKGMTVESIMFREFSCHYFMLPPLAEQHRIVAKIDELMTLCDRLEQQQSERAATHQALVSTLLDALTNSADHTEFAATWQRIAENFEILFTTEQSIDQLKQTVLQLAVMGKLVPFDGGATEFVLKELLEFGPRNGFSPKCVEYKTKFKVLKLGATSYGALNTDESKFVGQDIPANSHLLLKEGDILIQRGNSAKFVGSNVLIRQDYSNYIYPDLMMKIRVNDKVEPELLSIILMAPDSREFMWNAMTGTSGSMPKINKKIVEAIPIVIPRDRKVQRTLVERVDELLTLCDTLKNRLHQARSTQVQLADALVAQVVEA